MLRAVPAAARPRRCTFATESFAQEQLRTLPEFEPPSRGGRRDLREFLGFSVLVDARRTYVVNIRDEQPYLLSLRSLRTMRLGG